MNSKKASFSVYDIVSMVEAGEWDNVDIGIEHHALPTKMENE